MSSEHDPIAAFCEHLGNLCDVLSGPYDAKSLESAIRKEEVQARVKDRSQEIDCARAASS